MADKFNLPYMNQGFGTYGTAPMMTFGPESVMGQMPSNALAWGTSQRFAPMMTMPPVNITGQMPVMPNTLAWYQQQGGGGMPYGLAQDMASWNGVQSPAPEAAAWGAGRSTAPVMEMAPQEIAGTMVPKTPMGSGISLQEAGVVPTGALARSTKPLSAMTADELAKIQQENQPSQVLPWINTGVQAANTLANIGMGIYSMWNANREFDFQKGMAEQNLANSIKNYNTNMEDKIRARYNPLLAAAHKDEIDQQVNKAKI